MTQIKGLLNRVRMLLDTFELCEKRFENRYQRVFYGRTELNVQLLKYVVKIFHSTDFIALRYMLQVTCSISKNNVRGHDSDAL